MKEPLLLTPGPLTTSTSVKEAMLRDWGSRDAAFIALNKSIRERLVQMINGERDYVCVPMQGSGTFSVEATIGTLVARDGKVLVLVNGAYGQRMVRICSVIGRAVETLEWPEDEVVDPSTLDEFLKNDQEVTHVAVVHCETTSGILNPLQEVADVVHRRGRHLIIDSMSAFGALEIDAAKTPFSAVVASSNKCLEGVPGVGFALVKTEVLRECEGNAHSPSLDLYAQWRGFESNDQWRFTPPTHVLAAFDQALNEHEAAGGVRARGARYSNNHRVLVEGMRSMGFECLLDPGVQAPIIVTFLMPANDNFRFLDFYDHLSERGFLIYPGKLTVADSFRIGCIGHLDEHDIRNALDAIREVLELMDVSDARPSRSLV